MPVQLRGIPKKKKTLSNQVLVFQCAMSRIVYWFQEYFDLSPLANNLALAQEAPKTSELPDVPSSLISN